MLLSPRSNSLTSLFKEVRVFKEMPGAHEIGAAISGPQNCGVQNYGYESEEVVGVPKEGQSKLE